MAITLKYTLHAREKQDGTHAVQLRITKDRAHTYYNTGLTVKKAHWNAKAGIEKPQWVRTANRDHGNLNTALLDLLERARLLAITDPELTREGLRDKLAGGSTAGTVDFMQFLLHETERQEHRKYRTGKRYRTLYNKLKGFNGISLPFQSVTFSFLRDFAHYMEKQGNKATTINGDVSKLRTLLRLAKAEGKTDVPMPEPYLLKGKPAKKDALTAEELLAFKKAELPNFGAVAHLARTTYLLQFYLHGARVGDVVQLKRSDITKDRVTFGMQKTEHAKSIEIVPELRALMQPFMEGPADGYLLPWIKRPLTGLAMDRKIESITTLVNRYLKEFAKAAGIEKRLTSHTARHTFASIALGKVGNIRTIQQLLGHSRIATTEVYLRHLTTAETDEAAAAVYGITAV